ncbi:MAG: hypothetical protein O8C62_06325 [Candidatus Methanoperedens sp.]|nr:hypothetical protein [Candidatus Methanoperedens sp.]
MIDTSKIIYSINIEDVQSVAEQELERELGEKELKIIENKIGDYIDWYEAINMAIIDNIVTRRTTRKQKRGKE